MTRPLRFESFLGENVDDMSAALVDRLGDIGVASVKGKAAPFDERLDRIKSGEFDIAWMCGLLTVDLLDGGLDAEIAAAPVFVGESQPVYRSVIVAERPWHLADLDGAVVARNETGSWSGWHAFLLHLQQRGLDDRGWSVVDSGSHRRSLDMLVGGAADVACIDHTLWEHWSRRHPGSPLRVVDKTRDWPAPPIVVRRGLARDEVASSLMKAAAGRVLSESGLACIVPASIENYQTIRLNKLADWPLGSRT